MIFFSEGLAIPPAVVAQFRSVIDTANRANVSIYAMDAAGLRTESTSKETRENINAAAARTLARNPTADVTGTAMTQALEKNEDNLRLDPHSGLGELAGDTGGLLIKNTNDLSAGFRRVDEDMRNYYVLTYVPSNDVFDGKFRTIKVNVKRSGIDVSSRKGYFAVRAPGAQPVRTFEAPALAMLDVTPVPNAFPVRAVAVKFPERERPGLVPVLVSLSASNITFVPSEDKLTQHADFTVLVRFRDQANEIVRKLSQHYQFDGSGRQGRGHEAGRGALLPADGAAAGRLHDGDRRVRRRQQPRQRALLDRRAAQGGRRRPAGEQPAGGRPERDGWPRPIAPPTTRFWSATSCCIRTSGRRCRRRKPRSWRSSSRSTRAARPRPRRCWS